MARLIRRGALCVAILPMLLGTCLSVSGEELVSVLVTPARAETAPPAESPAPSHAPLAEEPQREESTPSELPAEENKPAETRPRPADQLSTLNPQPSTNHPDGVWTEGDSAGRVLGRGEYRQRSRQGRWVRWFAFGEGEMFKSDLYDGFQAPFTAEVDLVDGKIEGLWTIYDAHKQVASQWQFHDGVPHGKSVWRYPDGHKRQEIDYRDGQVDGRLLRWDAEHKLIADEAYANGKRLSKHTEFYDTDQPKARGWYVRAEGVSTTAFDWWEGIAKTVVQPIEPEDQKHGVWTWWYTHGQKAIEGRYREGVPVGRFTVWHANGQKQLEGAYVDGRQQGKFCWWHPNGQKQMEGHYTAGTRSGEWKTWSPEGQLMAAGDPKTLLRDTDQPVIETARQSDVHQPVQR